MSSGAGEAGQARKSQRRVRMMAAWKVRRAERPVQKSRRSGEDELAVMKAPCLMGGVLARGGPGGGFCVSA